MGVSRIHPKRPDSDPSDLLVAAELLLRQVPEEEEDDDRKKENDDDFDTTDDGYPVSTRINYVANDDEACSAPVELTQIQNRLFQ